LGGILGANQATGARRSGHPIAIVAQWEKKGVVQRRREGDGAEG